MSDPGQPPPRFEGRRRRRRLLGLVMILASIVLVLLGQFAFGSYLEENLQRFALYWTVCGVFAVAAMLTALVDLSAIRREANREERRLMERTLHGRKDGDENSPDVGTKA